MSEYSWSLQRDANFRRTSILFVGKRWDDKRLIAAAYAYEQGTRHRDAFKSVIEGKLGLETGAQDVSTLTLKTSVVERTSS